MNKLAAAERPSQASLWCLLSQKQCVVSSCHAAISRNVLLCQRPDDCILSKGTTFFRNGNHLVPDRWLKVKLSSH